ncbi:MAG TPA: restriction endonuclease [Candidatus Uhrbacteria bacterium]|nr:restriction endonuclease [Candidatus Uhrbacteria bacterium]
MNIKDVKTATKVGDFVLKKGNRNKIGFQYSSDLDKKALSDDSARIYLITQDGIIKKIGGSIQKGGIKGTISFYIGAMTGSPVSSTHFLDRLSQRFARVN